MGFRGFEQFELSNLRPVNLLVGKNNCGKTSILEAVDLLLSRGDPIADPKSSHSQAFVDWFVNLLQVRHELRPKDIDSQPT